MEGNSYPFLLGNLKMSKNKRTFIILVLFITIAQIAYASNGEWFLDKRTGCKFWNSNPGEINNITWSGKCINGKVHGYGMLEWYMNGKKVWIDKFTSTNGMKAVNGKYAVSLDFGAMEFRLFRCKSKWRTIDVLIPRKIELGYGEVTKSIFKEAIRFANKQCINTQRGTLIANIGIYYKDKPPLPNHQLVTGEARRDVVGCDNRDSKSIKCNHGYHNHASTLLEKKLIRRSMLKKKKQGLRSVASKWLHVKLGKRKGGRWS